MRLCKLPQEEHEWCLGVLDGKHIAFRAKKNDGSYYYNYKSSFRRGYCIQDTVCEIRNCEGKISAAECVYQYHDSVVRRVTYSMDVEEIIMLWYLLKKKKIKRKRAMWVHPIVEYGRLKEPSFYYMKNWYKTSKFFNYFRMPIKSFEELHTNLKDKLLKKDTVMRKSITTKERLAITLR
jgi:hypothetical protein